MATVITANITLVPTTGPTTPYQLPTISNPIRGRVYVIRDKDGNAPDYPITVTAGKTALNQDQYFSDGTTSFQITEPFGFMTVSETDVGVYTIISTSKYPNGFTNYTSQQYNISTGIAQPNLTFLDTQNAIDQYKVFVSSGNILINSINATNPQTNNELIQITTEQYLSTNSSLMNSFTPTGISVNYISTIAILAQKMYVSSLFANTKVTEDISYEDGDISSIITIGNILNINEISTTHMSSFHISAANVFFKDIGTTTLEPYTILTTDQTYANLVFAPEISSAIMYVKEMFASKNISTNGVSMETIYSKPAFISSVNTTYIESQDGNAGAITTDSINISTPLFYIDIYNGKGTSTNSISTGNMYIGNGEISSVQFYTLNSDTVSTIICVADDVSTNIFSMDILELTTYDMQTVNANTISTTFADISQLILPSMSNTAFNVSAIVTSTINVNDISTNTISTANISAASAFFSVLSTNMFSTLSAIGINGNFNDLRINTFSTNILTIGSGIFTSTITSTLTAQTIESVNNSIISSFNSDFISANQIITSTISTVSGNMSVMRISTIRNTPGSLLPNISAGRFVVSTIRARNVFLIDPISADGSRSMDQLSAGTMSVGYLNVSSINRTTAPINAGILAIPEPSLTVSNSGVRVPVASTLVVNNTMNIIPYSITSLIMVTTTDATKTIVTSPDGVNWTSISIAGIGTNGIRGVAYSASQGLWVAVGGVSSVLISSNGINWTPVRASVGIGECVAYSPDQNLWAIGGSSSFIYTSPNGIDWTPRTTGLSTSGTEVCLDIVYSSQQKLWIAAGNDNNIGGATIITSPDAITWTSRTTAFKICHGVAYSIQQNLWVAVGYAASGTGYIQLSSDGITWSTAPTYTTSVNYMGVAYSEKQNVWIAIAQGSTVYRSTDARVWTSISTPAAGILYKITYNPVQDLWIAVGATQTVITSKNGLVWSRITAANFAGDCRGLAVSYSGPEISNAYMNIYSNPSSISASDNSVNNIIGYTSTLVFNSTLYIQNGVNTVGINTMNPRATLDIAMTSSFTGSTVISSILSARTFTVSSINADTYIVSSFATTSIPSTLTNIIRRGIFNTLTVNTISTPIIFMSSLDTNEIIPRFTNYSQTIANEYEGGQFQLRSVSTFEISTGNAFIADTITINTVSTATLNIYKDNPASTFIMTSATGNSNLFYTSYDAINWTPVQNPRVNQAGNFLNTIPGYNPYGKYWVFPNSSALGSIYTYDFQTYSTLNMPGFTNAKFYMASSSIQIMFDGTGNYRYKSDSNPVGLWTSGTSITGTISVTNYGVYNEVRFVVCGGGTYGTTQIVTSENGTTWTARGNTPFDTAATCIAWNGNRFAAVATQTANVRDRTIATSRDGITWYSTTTSIQIGLNSAIPTTWIAANSSNWVITNAVTNSGGTATMYWLSEDLSTIRTGLWSTSTTAVGAANPRTTWIASPGGAYRVAWNPDPGVWFVSGQSGSGSTSAYSSNGINWYPLPPNTPITSTVFGSIITTPNILLRQTTLTTSQVSTISTIGADLLSTNRVSQLEFTPSTLSTYIVNADIGYYSTVAISGPLNPSFALNVSGIINATIDVVLDGNPITSDSNVKTNIELADIDKCYATMESLPLRRYTYTSIYSDGIQDKTQLGFVAQEVQPIFPKSVYPIYLEEENKDILHLTFDQIFINSYGATQKLISIVEERQSTISTLYSTVDMLQSRLSTLKGNNM